MVQNWKAKEIKLHEFCFSFLLRIYPSCPESLAVCTERKQEAPLTYVKNPLRTLGFASSARSWEELLTRVVTWTDYLHVMKSASEITPSWKLSVTGSQ